MLDKSVPYASLYMHRKAGTPIPEFPLPPGFRYVMYKDGNEADWARIETSVGEFDSEFSALMYFKDKFMPHADELARRLLFIETDAGEKAATANAWWASIVLKRHSWLSGAVSKAEPDEDRRAWLHWVSADVRYQGLGLGKAVTSRTMHIMREIEGDVDMYLSTQTWSYKAIDIYKKCGFEPTDEKKLYKYAGKSQREYKKALKILSRLERKR